MINPKNVRPTEVNNHARTIITTNKQNPIPIDVKSKDRRYVVFQATNAYVEPQRPTKFWTMLYNYLRTPETMTALYQYFMSFDLKYFDWIKNRPVTQAYKEMCSLYSPIEAIFFEEFRCLERWNEICDNDFTKDDAIKITFSLLFEMFEKFCKKNRFLKDETKACSIRTFVNRLVGLELPLNRVKSDGVNCFVFVPEEVYKFIDNKGWINAWKMDIEEIPKEVVDDFDYDNYFK